jgi:FAD/FMN-containing dehydrogenase
VLNSVVPNSVVPNSVVPNSVVLNDIHSRLNPTRPREVCAPRTTEEVVAAVRDAARRELPIAVCAGRHAMGGQQFVHDGLQLDMSECDGFVDLDGERGLVTVQAGMQWPGLLSALRRRGSRLTFRQKQTGADRLSIGGALSANIHGRGLRFPPFVSDIEAFTLVDADGRIRRCTRELEPALFALAVGGYGLFGVVTDVTLRLVPRRKVRRQVEVTTLDAAEAAYDKLVAAGCEYGDFQFATEPTSDGFLSDGVLSTYLPVADDAPVTPSPVALDADSWRRLLVLAHNDRTAAFRLYAEHYRATDGQVYHSDEQQLGVYVDGYHARLGGPPASEMITEVYLPRAQLLPFMAACREDFRRHAVELIYGTVRAIGADSETFLPWAQGDRACVIFNLHVRHDDSGIAKAVEDFRRIIDRAIERDGSFYLTYHRWATRDQLLAGHPKLPAFLAAKRLHDPQERFQSQWYRHLTALVAACAGS